MSNTAKRYKVLFASGRVSEAGLLRAVARGLISQDEYNEIIEVESEA